MDFDAVAIAETEPDFLIRAIRLGVIAPVFQFVTDGLFVVLCDAPRDGATCASCLEGERDPERAVSIWMVCIREDVELVGIAIDLEKESRAPVLVEMASLEARRLFQVVAEEGQNGRCHFFGQREGSGGQMPVVHRLHSSPIDLRKVHEQVFTKRPLVGKLQALDDPGDQARATADETKGFLPQDLRKRGFEIVCPSDGQKKQIGVHTDLVRDGCQRRGHERRTCEARDDQAPRLSFGDRILQKSGQVLRGDHQAFDICQLRRVSVATHENRTVGDKQLATSAIPMGRPTDNSTISLSCDRRFRVGPLMLFSHSGPPFSFPLSGR